MSPPPFYPRGEPNFKLGSPFCYAILVGMSAGLRFSIPALRLVAIIAVVLPLACGRGPSGPVRVAILPFVAADPAHAYLGAGLAEAVIRRLAATEAVTVLARAATASYTNGEADVARAAAALDAAAVVTGKVERDGSRITLECRMTTGDDMAWERPFNMDIDAIFELEGEIVSRIFSTLRVEMTRALRRVVSARPARDVVAYDRYLQSRYLFHLRTRNANEEAIVLLTDAISRDSTFALARATLADAYTRRANLFSYPSAWADSAEAEARRAIAADPTTEEAHKALAYALAVKGQVREGLAAAIRSVEIAPNYAPGVELIANMALTLGRFDVCAPILERAVQLRPDHSRLHASLGLARFATHDLDGSRRALDRALELDPASSYALAGRGAAAMARGDVAEMERIADDILSRNTNDFFGLHLSGEAALAKGDFVDAEKRFAAAREASVDRHPYTCRSADAGLGFAILNQGHQSQGFVLLDAVYHRAARELARDGENYYAIYEMAATMAARLSNDDALDWLRQAVEAGWSFDALGRRDPFFKQLHNDARFLQLMDAAAGSAVE